MAKHYYFFLFYLVNETLTSKDNNLFDTMKQILTIYDEALNKLFKHKTVIAFEYTFFKLHF